MCEREQSKQWTVQSDEADGNHSLDRQGREEVGEEKMGLAVKSTAHRNNIFKPFSKDATAQISAMRKAGSQIIMVTHHDEPTVPDWNINMLARKKEECILPHILCELHCFLLTDERKTEAYDYDKRVRKPQMAGSMTYNPMILPNTPTLSAVCSGAVFYL